MMGGPSMMVIRHRSALFSVALAALLVSTFVGAGASAAAAVRLAANSCDTAPAFFGLHGMGEGPGGTRRFLRIRLCYATSTMHRTPSAAPWGTARSL